MMATAHKPEGWPPREEVAKRARRMWREACRCPGHPGLRRRNGIKYIALRAAPSEGFTVGEIVNLLRIWPDGTKRYLKGGQIAGTTPSHSLGEHDQMPVKKDKSSEDRDIPPPYRAEEAYQSSKLGAAIDELLAGHGWAYLKDPASGDSIQKWFELVSRSFAKLNEAESVKDFLQRAEQLRSATAAMQRATKDAIAHQVRNVIEDQYHG